MNIRIKLVLILLIALTTSPGAWGSVPGDQNGDKIVSDSELESAKQANYKGEINSSQFAEIEHIHDNYPREVVDGNGKKFTLYCPLKRIVCFHASSIEVLRTLKVLDKIVGIDNQALTEQADFYPELSKLTSVGSVTSPNSEAAIALHPDAAIVYNTYQTTECDTLQKEIEKLDPSIIVLHFDCHKPEYHISDVEKLGVIMEKEKEAEEYLQFYKELIGKINSTLKNVKSTERPRIYLEGSNDYKSCAKGSGYHQKIEMAGGDNIFANLTTPYPTVDPEAVLVKDPQIVIKLVGHADSSIANGYSVDDSSSMQAIRSSMMNRPGWSNMTAVKNDQVYVISNEIYGGAHFFVGVSYLAKVFYPDRFKDLDPRSIHQEHITRFQGMDLELDKHGVFFVPEVDEK
jgi:iron complex transport system substrate-binding protein